ncbi:MAG: inositol monophosphatase [Proteobacteria bacterium]|nr:inositol monophosphatase [Pseudomonadota bacterium]
MNIERRLALACEVVREAGTLALASFRNASLVVESKGVQDYVTAVDRAVEQLIVDRLHAQFPGDAFLGEEGGRRTGTDGGALWVIDPIDGTVNYTRGLPLWCISLALVDAGDIAFGLIFNPVSDEFYCAVRGQGATCNDRPIRVSDVQSPEAARIGMGFSYRRPPALHAQGIARLLEAHCEYARLGSGALGLAFVADGRFDGYWEPHINSWDVLAGICLVREAGGWVSDFLAGDGLLRGNPILACTPGLKTFLQEQLTTPGATA